MQVHTFERDAIICIALIGELDHHAARQAMDEIARIYDKHLPPTAELDMGGVSFMDSSGIALILSTLRRAREIGGKLRVSHVPHQAMRVLNAAGIERLVEIVPDVEREVF